jgi:hypothetical protein
MSTRPTTLAGLAAVTAYFREGEENHVVETIFYDGEHVHDFLDTVAEVVRSVRQSS